MSYNEQLNKLIKKSGLAINEIAKRCEEYNVKITPQYITNLKNSRNKSASDEISVAIAKVCGAECPEILAIEGFIDKAPDYMMKFFEKYKNELLSSILIIYKAQLPEEQYQIVKDGFESMSVAEFIVAYNKSEETNYSNVNVTDNKLDIKTELTTLNFVTAKDDAMSPLLLKDGRAEYVPIKIDEIVNGDIICYIQKGKREECIRKCVLSDDKSHITMYPINPKYKAETFEINDIKIIGKTKQFVTTI